MKKILVLALTLVVVFAFFACEPATAPNDDPNNDVTAPGQENEVDNTVESLGEQEVQVELTTYDEFIAAPVETPVVVETYVQATQSWWENEITVYTQNQEGAYFIYGMECSEQDAQKLVPGTKIRVSGYKAEWEGEIEIVDATFEFVEGDSYIAQATDVTELLASEELINHQNKLVSFKGMTIDSIEYKNGTPGDDIYVNVSKDGATYGFCVEYYLTGSDTDVYKAVQQLKSGDVVDIQGFLYWYQGVNTHITSVEVIA